MTGRRWRNGRTVTNRHNSNPRASIQGEIISTSQSKQSKVTSNSLGLILVEVLFIKSVTCRYRFIKLHKVYLNKTGQIQDSLNCGCKDFF